MKWMTIPPSPGKNLLGKFEQEVAIHLAALDLHETGGGQGETLATLRESLELELLSGAPVNHQRLFNLVHLVETHIGPNQELVSLVKKLKRPEFSNGLISYLPNSDYAGDLVYQGVAYPEVLVVVDLAGLSQTSTLKTRLTKALRVTLLTEQNKVTFTKFLQQQATIDSPEYRFSYSEVGLYRLLQSNLPAGVSLGSSPDFVQVLQALTNQNINITSVLLPVLTAITEGVVENNTWMLPVNQTLTTLKPDARLKLASAFGLGYLEQAMSVLPQGETVLTEKFLDQLADYKLLQPNILQKDLERGDQDEVEEVLQRVSPETLQTYAQQFGQNAHDDSDEQDTQDTLVKVFELASDKQKVILARSLSEQYQRTQDKFLLSILERIEAEAILQEQFQIQKYEQYINDYWEILNNSIREKYNALASAAGVEGVVKRLKLQKLQNGLGEDLQEWIEDGNTTHLWEPSLFEQLQEYQTQIETITQEPVPVEVATTKAPTLPAKFVQLPLDKPIAVLYNQVVETSDTQVDGNIQPASERRLVELVITKIETEFDYGLFHSLGRVFESAEGDFAQKETWLRVLNRVKSAVTSPQWENFTNVFRREILSLGVNLPQGETYLNWLNISEGLPYVRLVNDSSILELTPAQVGGNWQPGEEIKEYNYRLENGFHLYELKPGALLPEGFQPRIAIATGEVLTGVVPKGFVAYEALNLIDSRLYGALPVVLPPDINQLRDQPLLDALAVGEAAEFQGAEPNVAYIAAAVIKHLENTWTTDLHQLLKPIFTGVIQGTYNADVWVHALSRVRNRSGKYIRLLTSFRDDLEELEDRVDESAWPAWQVAAGDVPGGGSVEDLAQVLNSDGSAMDLLVSIPDVDASQWGLLDPNIVAILKTPLANLADKDRVVLLAQELKPWGNRVPKPLLPLHNAVSQALYNRFTSSPGEYTEEQVLTAARWYIALNPGDSQETAQAQAVEEQMAETLFSSFQATIQKFLQGEGNEALQDQALQTLAEIQETFRSRFPNSFKNSLIRRGIEEITAERQQKAIAELESTATPIKKNIHAIWVGSGIDATKVGILEAWKTTNPDYAVNVWYDSNALLGNLMRRAINAQLDKIAPLPKGFTGAITPGLSNKTRGILQQRQQEAVSIYNQTEEYLRLHGGQDEARASLLVTQYRDFLIQELKLSPNITLSQLTAAVEVYREKQQQSFTDLSSNPNLRVRDLQTEVMPSSQNQDFYQATLILFGGAFASAADIARVEILKAEGGFYTDLDFLPGEPLGDFQQPQKITLFFPAEVKENELDSEINQGIPPLDVSMMTAHQGGQQISLQSDILQQNYQTYLKKKKTIHRLSKRNFAAFYTADIGVIAPSVRQLGQKLVGPTFDLLSFSETLSLPEQFFEYTPDNFVSSWEISREDDLGTVEVLFEDKFSQIIIQVQELRVLLNMDRSTLTKKEENRLEVDIEIHQEDLAEVFKNYFWRAVKELSPVNPSTGRIISLQVEERVFELLEDHFEVVPTSFLSYNILRDLMQKYLRNQLPAQAYGSEQVSFLPNVPSLDEAFQADLAASRITLDLATKTGALTEEQALFAARLEINLRVKPRPSYSTILKFLKSDEQVIQANPLLRTLKRSIDTENLIGYERAATGKGWAIYSSKDSKVEIVVDLNSANDGDEVNDLLDEAISAFPKNEVSDAFLHLKVQEGAGYHYRYSAHGVYNLVAVHLGDSFTPLPDREQTLVVALVHLASNKTPWEVSAALQPRFDDVAAGVISPQLWSSTLNLAAQQLSSHPQQLLKFLSGLGLANLSNLRTHPSSDPGFVDFLTGNLLDQVGVFKLLDTEIFNRELNTGNSREVYLILLSGVASLTPTALTERLNTIVTEVSGQPKAVSTLASAILLVVESEDVTVTDKSRLYGALGADNVRTLEASQPELATAITEFLSSTGALPQVYAQLVQGLPDSFQH